MGSSGTVASDYQYPMSFGRTLVVDELLSDMDELRINEFEKYQLLKILEYNKK